MRGLLYLIILIILAGCSYSSSQPRVLDEAQRLMESDPTSALSKLNSLDISELRDSSTLARWALLYSEAMVENRLTTPTGSRVEQTIG